MDRTFSCWLPSVTPSWRRFRRIGVTETIGSTPFEDIESNQFIDEELTVTTEAMRNRSDLAVDDDMLADAFESD